MNERPIRYQGPDFRKPEERAAAVAGLRRRLDRQKVLFMPPKSPEMDG